MATAASGYKSLKLQTGTEDPFVELIDELLVISENERNKQLNSGLPPSILIDPH